MRTFDRPASRRYSTYVLFMVSVHAPTSNALYRALSHSGVMFGLMQFGVYIPLLLWLVNLALAAHMHLGVALGWICTVIVAGIYSAAHLVFVYTTVRGFPRGMWGWLGITAPWLYFSDRVKRDVSAADEMFLMSADKGVLAGKDEDHDGKVDRGPYRGRAEIVFSEISRTAASAEYPRRGRAATRLRGMPPRNTSWPPHRRDPPPWHVSTE